jgi:hypothetical protein
VRFGNAGKAKITGKSPSLRKPGAAPVPGGGAMSEIRVECHAGYRADERPLRFVLRGRPFEINELDGRWYSPDASYFRVRAEDGNYYVLRHDEVQDLWTLDGFRAMR